MPDGSLPALLLLAAGSAPPFFAEVAAVILAGALIAYVCSRLGVVPIAGFLVAGVAIGPHGLGLVRDPALVDAAAEVGVVLLLFTIGIEFSLGRLAALRRLILIGGSAQVGLSIAVTALLLAAFGVDWRVGVFTGFLVAQSSTAIMLKLLSERGETTAQHGQVAVAVSLFQDMATIAMVLLIPVLGGAGGSGGEIAGALGRAALVIGVVLVVARRVLPVFLEIVARTCSPEVFLLTVIAICFGTAYLCSLAGVSLSLGAFLAGLMVSESRFSEHALGEILPLQVLFSATFFVSVGMLLDLRFVAGNLLLVAAVVAAVWGVKMATGALAAAALRLPAPTVILSAALLAQVGEFSFVLERAGREAGLVPAGMEGGGQVFIATTVTLMILTPFLARGGARLARALDRTGAAAAARRMAEAPEPDAGHLPKLENHVIVAGYGDAARKLVKVLRSSGVPYVITTLSPAGAAEAEAEGLPVLRGDATRQRTLQLAGAERAKMMVIADDDPATAYRIAAVGRETNPTMRVVVRTRHVSEVEPLTRAGADHVVAEDLEGIVQLFAHVLREYRITAEEIERHEAEVRSGGYAALRDAGDAAVGAVTPCAVDDDCLTARIVRVRPGMPVVGRTLDELAVEADLGLRVRDVLRGAASSPAPGAEVLRPGDEVVLAGTAEAFLRAADLFRAARADGAGGGGAVFTPIDAVAARGTPALPGDPGADPRLRADIDPEAPVTLDGALRHPCAHVPQARTVFPGARGCEACLRDPGATWVHLRLCMTCGHVGCCDSSPGKHATAHHHATGHPIVRSLEPGEFWAWCYPDGRML